MFMITGKSLHAPLLCDVYTVDTVSCGLGEVRHDIVVK